MDDALHHRTGKNFPWLIVIIITSIGLAAYFTSLSGEFIWDDIHFIKDNVYLRSLTYFPQIMIGDVAAGSGESYNYYRPLTTVTYLFDFSFWGLNPVGYHISGIFLHILVALMVYFFVRILFQDSLVSFITALLYLIHPIQTETVAYISGRPDSLAVLFTLACFISYIKHLSGARGRLNLFSIFFYLLALLSRENSVVLPGLILLFHICFRKKMRCLNFLPLIMMAAGYVILRMLLMEKAVVPTTFPDRLPGFFIALIKYLRLIIFPVNLHQEYGFQLFSPDDLRVLVGIILAVIMIILAVRGWVKKTGSITCFSIFWFFIALGPVSGIYPIKAYIAEHWLYLPSIGFFTLAASAYVFLLRRGRYRTALIVAGSAVILIYGVLTAHQNMYFSEPLAFYERTLIYNPTSARMYNNLGNIYYTRGRVQDAIKAYRKAIALEPNYPNPYNNLGNVFYQSGDYETAVPLFIKALKLNPGYGAAYNNLGIIYCRLGRTEKGLEFLKKALFINPNDADTLYNLGVVYDMTDCPSRAVEAYRKSLDLRPDSARVHYRLSQTLRGLGRIREAEYHYRRAQEIEFVQGFDLLK